MAARAIDPVQLQLLFKGWSRHETLQLCDSHVRHVLENHMLPDHFDRRLDFSARKSQATHNRFRHLSTDSVVFVEANAARFIYSCRDWFCDIVK